MLMQLMYALFSLSWSNIVLREYSIVLHKKSFFPRHLHQTMTFGSLLLLLFYFISFTFWF